MPIYLHSVPPLHQPASLTTTKNPTALTTTTNPLPWYHLASLATTTNPLPWCHLQPRRFIIVIQHLPIKFLHQGFDILMPGRHEPIVFPSRTGGHRDARSRWSLNGQHLPIKFLRRGFDVLMPGHHEPIVPPSQAGGHRDARSRCALPS